MAFSPEEKLFYLSSDSWTWEKVSDVPVPVENLSSITYCPELQWYCAAGKQTTSAYFSKDLKHWVSVPIRYQNLDINSIIYMPSLELFVAFPASGTYTIHLALLNGLMARKEVTFHGNIHRRRFYNHKSYPA